MKKILSYFPVAALMLTGFIPRAQQTVTLSPVKDNSLYESSTGSLSNGAGSYLFSGTTNNGDIRRCLLQFDVAGNVPAGATITSATLTLSMNKTISGSQSMALHRVTQNWGEGSSNASGDEGAGASSQTGDATWVHAFYNTVSWSSNGGDYIAQSSASTNVSGTSSYNWSSTQFTSDVQLFLDSTARNFGWILIGNESSSGTAKRFGSREGPSTAAPSLSITYTSPCSGPSLPTISLSTDTICLGETATITATGNLNDASTWVLYADSCGKTFVDSNTTGIFLVSPTLNTAYFVRGEGGCVIPAACSSANIAVISIEDSIVVNATGSQLTALQAGASYQWLDCNNGNTAIAGANQQSYSPSNVGNYAVAIMLAGCTDTSDCVPGMPIGLERYRIHNEISVYPNPAGKYLYIEFPEAKAGNGTLQILDLRGKVIASHNFNSPGTKALYIEDLPAGIYFLRIDIDGYNHSLPFIKE